MSSSDAPRISLQADYPATELRVVDSDFRIVASGVGALNTDVAPGIYRIEAQLGAELSAELVALDSGDVYDQPPLVALQSAAPVSGTSTSHEYHQAAATEASSGDNAVELLQSSDARLVLVVRALEELGDPPATLKAIRRVEVRSASGDPIPGADEIWREQPARDAVTWSADLPAGGYVLRHRPIQEARLVVDHPVWLSSSWQTLLFLRTTQRGLAFDTMSVHMAERSSAWNPSPDSSNEALAVEAALEGLSVGRRLLTDRQLDRLLHGKFVNPFLGILGAHNLLLEPSFDKYGDLLNVVISNLHHLVPDHPDLAAIKTMAAEKGIGGWPLEAPVTFPPMLLASFLSLLRHDAVNPGTIAADSVACAGAPGLVVQGLWTTYTAPAAAAALREEAGYLADPPANGRGRGGDRRFRGRGGGGGGGSGGGRMSRRKAAIRGRGTPRAPKDAVPSTLDQAADLVAQYVQGIANTREISVKKALKLMDEKSVSLATYLPRETVRAVLPAVAAELSGGRGRARRGPKLLGLLAGLVTAGSLAVALWWPDGDDRRPAERLRGVAPLPSPAPPSPSEVTPTPTLDVDGSILD